MIKKIMLLIGIIILAFIVKDAIQYQVPILTYAHIINLNWSINISKHYEELYSTDSGESFHGDGERYHVFQYTNSKDILQSLDWTNSKNTDMEEEVEEIIALLDIPKEYLPDFQSDYQYYTTTKDDDHSSIYFIFVADTKKLYIIESML